MIEAWLAPGFIFAVIIAVTGWVWRLSGRLAAQDGRITAAQTLASNASAKAALVDQDLAAHKEHVAAEYMSRRELTDALNRIVDRIDTLVFHFLPKPPQT